MEEDTGDGSTDRIGAPSALVLSQVSSQSSQWQLGSANQYDLDDVVMGSGKATPGLIKPTSVSSLGATARMMTTAGVRVSDLDMMISESDLMTAHESDDDGGGDSESVVDIDMDAVTGVVDEEASQIEGEVRTDRVDTVEDMYGVSPRTGRMTAGEG